MSEHDTPRLITIAQAIALLPVDGEEIHTLSMSGGIMMGMSLSREHIEERIRDAKELYVAAGQMRGLRHGLVVYEEIDEDLVKELERRHQREIPRPLMRTMFVETDVAKLDAFDPPEDDVRVS